MQMDRSQLLATADFVPSGSGKAQARTRPISRDNYFLLVGVVAVILSLVSFAFFYSQNLTLEYYDSQAHLLITRRVVDSPTPGLAQLGGVWLPLTHVLAIPLIGNDFLYRSGIALSLISMLSFILTAMFLYQILIVLTGDKMAGLIAALIFITNPNMLYMQSTAMTEMPMYLSMAAAAYCLLRLGREPENRIWYFWSGFTIALSTLIRYEGWMLLLCEALVLLYIFIWNKFGLRKIEGLLIYWAYWALAGIAAWLLWNWVIFGDPLSFQRGEYARSSLWTSVGNGVTGHVGTSFWTFLYATLSSIGPIFFLGILAFLIYLVGTRLKGHTVVPLTLFCMFPFFVAMLYIGERPLNVVEISGYLYNIRFALVMLLPVAICVAYMTKYGWLPKLLVITIMAGTTALMVRTSGVVTLNEAISVATLKTHEAGRAVAIWLRDHYDGKPLLLENDGNDQVQFEAGISLKNVIYEGSYRIWDRAVQAPEQYVDWVLMRNEFNDNGAVTAADRIWQSLHDLPTFRQNFELVYQNETHQIYHKRTVPKTVIIL